MGHNAPAIPVAYRGFGDFLAGHHNETIAAPRLGKLMNNANAVLRMMLRPSRQGGQQRMLAVANDNVDFHSDHFASITSATR